MLGLLPAVLALTGIFSMASYSVSTRMKEHGIRIALGAKRLLARLGSFATPKDPLILVTVGVAMVLIGVAATWIPARRALRIDPAQLLREG